ncbi:MAG TPA: amino acid adenylation domain-containing protein [Acidisphaera sp.]|nr:amino acid adenylation domain-containing protein [Acidisphaera sp.]
MSSAAAPTDRASAGQRSGGPADRPDIQLTSVQMTFWLDQALHPGAPILNTGQTLRIHGALDTGCFAAALEHVVAAEDALRLRFVWRPPFVRAHVEPDAAIDLESCDLSQEPDPPAAADAWISRMFWRPLSPNDYPLFRFALLKLGPADFIWVQKYHHLLIDAAGREIVASHVADAYNRLLSGAALLPMVGSSVTAARLREDDYLASARFQADVAYWAARFADRPPPLGLPPAALSERSRSGRPARLAFELTAAESDAVRALARALGTTEFKLLLAFAWSFFSREYRETDIVFGVALANRSGPGLEHTVVPLSTMLMVRLDLAPDMSLAAALARLAADFARDLRHRLLPPDHVYTAAGVRHRDRDGFCEIVVNYIRAGYDFTFDGAPVTCAYLSTAFAGAWNVTALDFGPGSRMSFAITSDPGRVTAEGARRAQAAFQAMLRMAGTAGAADAAASPIGGLKLTETLPRDAAIRRGRGRTVDLPPDASLTDVLAYQAACTPDRIAVIHEAGQLTYRALHDQAQTLAADLIELGVGPGTVVGVCLPRTAHLLATLLAVHKAGAAYLPLDPTYPSARLDFMIAQSAATVIVTDHAHAPVFMAGAEPISSRPRAVQLALPTMVAVSKPARPGAVPALPSWADAGAGDALACVLFTSGSTGQPKGVEITHRGLVNILFACRELVEPEDLSYTLAGASVSFDLSMYEMFLPLAFGGTVVVADDVFGLLASPARDCVTAMMTGPTLLNAVLDAGPLPESLRVIMLGGEAVSRAVADRIFAARAGIRLFNAYGPTETTLLATWSLVERDDRDPPAIGRPFWNTELYVLDAQGALITDNATGELWIGGAGVTRGYCRRPDLTAERFRPNAYGEGRIYATGDLVHWREDGQLQFHGRVDHQIKLNSLPRFPNRSQVVQNSG